MPDSTALRATIDYNVKGRPAGKGDPHRWYPDEPEKASCCASVREPSRSYPLSLYRHCCSRKHVRQRILERPTELQHKALTMTLEGAPLHINDEGLLGHVAKTLLKSGA